MSSGAPHQASHDPIGLDFGIAGTISALRKVQAQETLRVRVGTMPREALMPPAAVPGHAESPSLRVSRETIYTVIYAMPRGELRTSAMLGTPQRYAASRGSRSAHPVGALFTGRNLCRQYCALPVRIASTD